MLKSLAISTLFTTVVIAGAQSQNPPDQQPPAPIVRNYPSSSYPLNAAPAHVQRRQPIQIVESQPTPGVWLRSESTSALTALSATPQRTELRLDHGRLNVTVHQPAQHSEILIDLPGGQTSLLKDGLYTFNADTNTVRVLRGEAAYIEPDATAKPIKIKEDHQLSLVSATPGKPADLKSVESYPYELTADLLPPNNHGEPDYPRYAGDYPYEYPYPYYADAWGYPYRYGFYPAYYGYGYPFAYGIGYYGGFGYHGGFRR